jgi:excisionase family DNA binding protein
MSQLTYSISREAASSYLGVSTRTIDRYVKSGKLSYKKVANKVILAKEQVDELKEEFAMLHQDWYQTEVMSAWSERMSTVSDSTAVQPMSSHNTNNATIRQLDQKMDKFFDLIREKDSNLEDKNKMIFVLQQKLGEMEGKLKHMIALPAYHEEKQQLIHDKEKLEQKVRELHKWFQSEKRKNTVYIAIMLALICAAVLMIFIKK